MANDFFTAVYREARHIPAGHVATYGMIAERVGRRRAARYVGFAMHSAPAGVPCHRVVNRLGEMAPRDVFGSEDYQRHLLMEEGVAFLADGRVDMEKHLWDGKECPPL